ncbi:MAG: DNA topoisomerase (ATP-hydrolyzing) subunit A, partial [Cyanobacteria bacterium J06641_5]
ENIGEATVDFTSNFDNSQQEPVVLPARLPVLLLNGCTGIAVGMATNMPPHNLGEIVDGAIALIDRPELSDEKLFEYIPGPDFPTGGEIIDPDGVRDAYRTGRGSFRVRGVACQETVPGGGKTRRRDRRAIVVTELPYQVNKAGWIEKVADLVNSGRIEGISDLRDESDRTGMRVVIELKRDVDPSALLAKLYRQTTLQSNYGIINLALVDNRPCQLSLRELLQEFLEFREQTLRRQYDYDLNRAGDRLHLAEGLLAALDRLDTTIDLLRNAPDGTTAKAQMQSQLGIDAVQADAILAMPLRRLTGLERQKLETEAAELRAQIGELQTLLNDRHELLKALKKELRALKRRFGNPRRTRIVGLTEEAVVPSAQTDPAAKVTTKTTKTAKTAKSGRQTTGEKPTKRSAATVEDRVSLPLATTELPQDLTNCTIELTADSRVSWRSNAASRDRQGSSPTVLSIPAPQLARCLVATASGKLFTLALDRIPPAHSNTPLELGAALAGVAAGKAEAAIGYALLPPVESGAKPPDLVLLSASGRIKRLSGNDYANLGSRGLSAIKLKSSDRLAFVASLAGATELAVATSGGRILRLPINDVQLPVLGRMAQGHQVTRLRRDETLVGCLPLQDCEQWLMTASASGYAKRFPARVLREVLRNELGTQAVRFGQSGDFLVGIVPAADRMQVLVRIDNGRSFYLSTDDVVRAGLDSPGRRLKDLQSEEAIAAIAPVQTLADPTPTT